MRSPTYALIWEQWRQVRTPVIFAIGLTAIGSWTLHQFMEMSLDSDRKWIQSNSENWGEISTVLAGICMILVIAALLFAHSSTRDLRMGLPARILTLPISSLRLAATQILFRLLVISLVALTIGLALTLIDFWYAQVIAPFVGFSVIVYAYASSIATTIGKRNPVIAFIAIVFTTSPVLASLVAIVHQQPNSSVSFYVFVIFVSLCIAVSIYRFATLRNTPPIQVLLLTRDAGLRGAVAHRERIAQYKFEWRRSAWIYPSFTAGVICMFGVPQLFLVRDFGGPESFAQFAFLMTPPVIAFVIGMILISREHRDIVTGVARFVWTRPLTVQQVVLNRMKVLGLSMLYTYLFVGTVTFLAMLLSGDATNIDLEEAVMGVAGFAAFLIGAWSIAWVPFVPVLFWLIVMSCLGITTLMGWRLHDNYIFLIAISAFWLLFALLARACARRRLFEERVVFRFLAFCVCLTVGAVTIYLFILSKSVVPAAMGVFIPVAITLSALPLFSLLWQGFFLDRVRHNALFRRLPARDS
ncbi:MAG: hypothetical protein IT366_19895 [Candidatus Hydrogenedentes bacterium]|nr:hypothetical protein [Candidatus Hydrogenedentota bacterium]